MILRFGITSVFFYQNYIVVGKSHEKTVEERVPASWGIIVISPDNVIIHRKAGVNKEYSIRATVGTDTGVGGDLKTL